MNSSYTFSTNSPQTSRVAYSELSSLEKQHEQSNSIQRTLDTIDMSKKGEKKEKVDVSGNRVVLPAPKTPNSANALEILGVAFAKAYTAMSQGTVNQAQSYAQLQQLNQTMSQSVLDMTQINIEKEQKEMKTADEIQKFQTERAAQIGTMSKVLMWLGIGIMAIIMIATVVSSVFDFGASDAALPEEIEMTEMLAEGGSDLASDVGGDVASDVSSDVASDVASDIAEDTTTDVTEEATQETTTETATNTETEASEGTSKLKSFMMKALKFAFGATMASPMLITGITQLQLRDKLLNLKTAQEELGTAMAQMEKTNGTYQFYQQLLSQQSGIINEEAKDASEVVQTFADITNAYKQISYGLAQAV